MEGASLHASLIGATIGNYKVVAKLGEGGMGAVYLAEHPLIGKKVALKVLHEEYSANQEVITRFFNEAKAVNDIGHPNIVDIIDYGVVQTPAGVSFVYFIMEFLQGEALSTVIQREAPLPPDRAMHVASQVADALASSHQKGIVHRDLKPDNIFLLQRAREKDFVKVLDFGIAKLTSNEGSPMSSRTRTGVVMGTPAYMSPEQCEGRGNIDHRTDVYALGIVLYEMLTGKVPFAGEGYGEVLIQHLTKPPARPSTVRGMIPPHVEALVMKALEKKRENRFENMEQFINAMKNPQGFSEAAAPAYGGVHAAAQQATLLYTGGQASQPYMQAPPIPAAPAAPGAPGAHPTTLTSGAGEVRAVRLEGTRSRLPVIIGAAVASIALLGVGGYFLFGRGGGKTTAASANAGVTGETDPAASPEPSPAASPVASPEPSPAASPVASPEPSPALSPTIGIHLTSIPSGARVFIKGESKYRCMTPCDVTLDRADGEVELIFRIDGYEDKVKTAGTARDSEIEVTLTKEQPQKDDRRDERKRDERKPDPKKDEKKDHRKELKPMPPIVDDDDVLAPT